MELSHYFLLYFRSESIPTIYDFAKAYYHLANSTSKVLQSEVHFRKSLAYFNPDEDHYSKLKILGFLIRICSERLENIEAEKWIKKAEGIVRELKDSLGTLTAEYYFNYGLVKNYSGDFYEAREAFLVAYKKSKEENEPELLAKCLLALATNFYQTKDYQTAINYLQQLKQLLKIINKFYLAGAMEFYLGKIYFEMDRYNDALVAFDNAAQNLLDKKCWNLHTFSV